jgi:ribosomal-protein-alanine N-acetyltransferase
MLGGTEMSSASDIQQNPTLFGRAYVIETGRLVLRPYTPDDWVRVHVYASMPDFSQFDVWGPNDIEDTKRYISECIANLHAQPIKRCELAIVLKEPGLLIGGCSLKHDAETPDEAGIGYAINPEYQRRGYATEAAVALIQFAFEKLAVARVYAQCDTRNTASRRVMEKAGLSQATVIEHHQEIRGVMTDSFRYEISREHS